jgi:hypothetical protein
LHEDQYIFLIISRSILLRLKNVSDKICRGNQNTHLCSKTYFHAIYEIIWKTMVQPDRPRMKIWHVRISRWIYKDKGTHTQIMQYLLLFHRNIGCTKAPNCYCVRILLSCSLLSIVGRFHVDDLSFTPLERTMSTHLFHCTVKQMTVISYPQLASNFGLPECKTRRIQHDQDFRLFPLPGGKIYYFKHYF